MYLMKWETKMAIKNYSDSIILVDLPAEPNIRAELDTLMDILKAGGNCDVIIDFSNIDIMTSLSLSGFLMVRELIVSAGKRLIFCNTSAITKDIFTVTCFDGVFEFVNNVDHAVETLTAHQPCETIN